MLKTSFCAMALALLATCPWNPAQAAGDHDRGEALHVLDRLAYGPAPGDLDRVATMGVDRYIDEQLAPQGISMPGELRQRLDALRTTRMSEAELFRQYGPPARRDAGKDEAARKQVQKAANRVAEEAMQARLLRAVYNPAQLQEVMTDFWFNHFNVFRGKGLEDRIWLSAYEREAIRPYALGRFRDLLGATAKHPAMLYYLDNWRSTVGQEDIFGDVKGGLNENYAREVMELHTLGVDGGYTQKDVTELARILTGWTYLPRDWLRGGDEPFRFVPKRHDYGDKVFLGQRFHGSGQDEGERALDMLAASPATARHISYQLAQYFVADDPPPALVDRLAKRFGETGGDIREVLRTLFHSPEFRDPANSGNKFKTPYQYVVSAVRASGVEVRNFRPLMGTLNKLGMPLYGCLTPDGYKNTESAWLNPDSMVYRLNFATALGAGKLPLLRHEETLPQPEPDDGAATAKPVAMAEEFGPQDRPPPVDPATLQATLGAPFSARTREALDAAVPPLRASLMLGSPEFMRH
ncbi:MAG: DUF1800 domain-containing protein [Nevskia sp.]|nr:DUF1800 domain-containing protein [Nevskia sp.]